MYDRDIVFLVGAGASYGAGHVRPKAPPLGACLYDALAWEYPKEWGSESHLGKVWAPQFREDFERTMCEEVLPRVSSLSLLEWHRPMAVFFAKYVLDAGERDMFSLLLSGLATNGLLGRTAFGSLNYDCLLEQAMLGLGFTADYMLDAAPSQGSIPLAKIHGSCNFITADLFSSRSFLTNANASSVECSFTALAVDDLQDHLRVRFSTHQPAFFPVIGLYSTDKPSLVAPGKLQSLRNGLAQAIGRATAVVLIGIKPHPRDPHLWAPVSQSEASTIAYVGCATDYEVLKKLQPKAVHLSTEFERAVPALLETLSGCRASIDSAGVSANETLHPSLTRS